jgi:hypothetical protein
MSYGIDCATKEEWAARCFGAEYRLATAQARIDELEVLLNRAANDIELGWLKTEGVEEKYNTDGSWHVLQDIHAALEDTTNE